MIRKLPNLPLVSLKTLDDEHGCSLRAHSHPELSVGLVLTDGTRVTVEGLDFSLASGDMILIPAEQVHLCRPLDGEAFRFLMLYIDAEWTEEVTGIPVGEIRPTALKAPPIWSDIFSSLEATPEDPEIPKQLTQALRSLAVREDSEAAGNAIPSPGSDEVDLLEVVHKRIVSSPQMELRVGEMAAAAGMSKYDFLRKYTQRYGLTPHSSVTDQRIRRSLELMGEGLELTRIAADCGFSDQSHFIRQFKLYTGMKPSEYRKAILSN